MPKQIPATKLTDVGTTALEGLGEIRDGVNDGKKYRYVQIKLADGKKGEPCGFYTSNNYQVTTSIHSADPEDRPAGVLIVDASSGNYTWVQCLGYNEYVMSDCAVAANARLYKDSAVKGRVTSGADGVRAIGTAVAADSVSTLGSVFIDCM